ncbi:hypothetical protein BGZ49_010172 [Haplosporangium sp. Z 27]|nr:hypothetical protein BGZ49_010172 [Haplosporangium sp. Z 27]
MVSERKKLLAILERRQKLEDEYNATHNEVIKVEMDSFNPSLMHYFRINTLQGLFNLYPKTADMRAAAEKQRYFAPRKTPQQRTGEIYEDLRRAGSDVDYLEFVRVSKSVFLSIVSSVLSQHQVFKNHSNNGQETVEKQLAITLWRLGHHGKDAGIGEASKIFGLSEGTIMKCTQRCMEALRDISLDIISWPVRGEKQTIKSRVKDIVRRGSHHSSPSTTINKSTTTATTPSLSLSGDYSRIANGNITDAVGILSTMYVYLVSRPLLTNTEEYLIPLPPSALEAVESLSTSDYFSKRKLSSKRQIGSDQETNILDATKSANKKRTKSLKDGTSSDPSSIQYTEEEEVPPRVVKRGRPRKNVQKSTPLPTVESTPTESTPPPPPPPPEKRVTRPRAPNFVKSAYLKRDYGYNVLIVCDSTTRIRFADVVRPAGWSREQVFASSQLCTESASHFEGNEYLIAENGFAPGPHVIPDLPESETDGNDASNTSANTTTPNAKDKAQVDSGIADMEHKKKIGEALKSIQNRAKDCQRTLKARFPSLLGMRVQLKNEPASEENARNWILACMTIHNLVLGDDSSYNMAWEDQLEEMESQVLKQQEQQARLIWKLENHPPRKTRSEPTAPTTQDTTVLIDNTERFSLEQDDYRNVLGDNSGEDRREATRILTELQQIYESEETPTPGAAITRMQGGKISLTHTNADVEDNSGRSQSGHSLSLLLN